mgnify:CR=1 FL=1
MKSMNPMDTRISLNNMIRHLRQLPSMARGCVTRVRTFAEDLAEILVHAYPDMFMR